MTLTGTNTYLVTEGDAVWIVDPGPRDEGHLETIRIEAGRRGEIAGVVLTHSHADHSEAADAFGVDVVWGQVGEDDEAQAFAAAADVTQPQPSGLSLGGPGKSPDGTPRIGPMEVLPTPGHAHDHVALVAGTTCLCGDLVLGEGSSIVPPRAHGGSLIAYLESLERLAALELDLLAPGHGPWITDPKAKIDQYIAHRLKREAKLLAALDAGKRSTDDLLDAAWDDVPEFMRPAAAIALQAHLEKLGDEARLPEGLGVTG